MLEFVALELHAVVERWVMIRNGVTECLESTRRPLARGSVKVDGPATRYTYSLPSMSTLP